MVRGFEPTGVFRLIQDEKATAMSLVPTMANALVNAPDKDNFDLSSLKEVFVGGAASSPELIARLEAALHCTAMGGYGLTETCPVNRRGEPTVLLGFGGYLPERVVTNAELVDGFPEITAEYVYQVYRHPPACWAVR